MSRFPNQYNYDANSLNNQVYSSNTYLEDNRFENDIYKFNISSTSDIRISLNNISSGDDAFIGLYRDTNNNGILDNSDLFVDFEDQGLDKTIDLDSQQSGTYFVRVGYYSGDSGSDGIINYDLDISATTGFGISQVIGVESDLGNLNEDVTRSGVINSSNIVDTYQFDLGFYEGVNISLSGLSADADINLVQDRNNDGLVQTSEIIGSSNNGSNFNELISGIDQSGTYQLLVYQYSGNTNYTVNFDHYSTSFL